MKNLKRYNQLFENTQELTQEQKDWLDQGCGKTPPMSGKYRGHAVASWRVNPETGLVDVKGTFDCSHENLTDFKGVRFGHVSKNFECDNNNLVSLDGAPRIVGRDFFGWDNNLTSLEGAPQRVGGDFYCSNNNLSSLKFAPASVGKDFICDKNELISLEGLPKDFQCKRFYCRYNSLKSLEGAPHKVELSFNCSNNSLTSLKYCPQKIGKYFACSYNNLTSLEGAPKGDAFLKTEASGNPISEKSIKGIIKNMWAWNLSLEKSVLKYWKYASKEDRIYLAKHNPDLTPEEKRIYRAMELNMKRR